MKPASQAASVRVWWLALGFLAAVFVGPAAFALDPTEKPENYIIAHWDTEDGLPHNSARQIFQTRDGYLWVATQLGLARFDGLSFTVFNRRNTPAMINESITSMAETSDGSLWIGTGNGLLRYLDGSFTRFDRSSGMKSETINTVCVVPDGSLWIGTLGSGLFRWSNNRLDHYTKEQGLFDDDVFSKPLSLAGDNDLVLCTVFGFLDGDRIVLE